MSLGGGLEQTAMNGLTRGVRILQRGLQTVEGSRFGLPGVGPERSRASRRLDPAGGDRRQDFVQALGATAVQAHPAQQDHPRDRVAGLYQAGAGQVVMDETLGAESGQQALRHPLLQVQVHRVVGEHARVLEDHRGGWVLRAATRPASGYACAAHAAYPG